MLKCGLKNSSESKGNKVLSLSNITINTCNKEDKNEVKIKNQKMDPPPTIHESYVVKVILCDIIECYYFNVGEGGYHIETL